jgi:high-affinity Fe2+/Pb2+ permease
MLQSTLAGMHLLERWWSGEAEERSGFLLSLAVGLVVSVVLFAALLLLWEYVLPAGIFWSFRTFLMRRNLGPVLSGTLIFLATMIPAGVGVVMAVKREAKRRRSLPKPSIAKV